VGGYLYSADVEGSGGPAGQTPPRQTFSLEYVQELREEAKGNRVKLTAAEQALAEAAKAAEQAVGAAAADTAKAKTEMADAIAAARAEAESHKIEVKTTADLRIIRAELKAEALKAGMIDMDGLKLIDTTPVTIGEDGEVKIPDGFFKTAKEAKPWLFGAVSSTSATHEPPPKQQPGPKPAAEWTAAERSAFEQKHKIRA
jgi:hypothetical protein